MGDNSIVFDSCQFCGSWRNAKYVVSNGKAHMSSCGSHLPRAVDFFVMPEGEVTVKRLK